MTKRIVVGITGASGAPYAKRLVEVLAQAGVSVELIMTKTGEQVFNYECETDAAWPPEGVTRHANSNLFSPLASGSYRVNGMVVIPCSLNTLGLIASGTGDNLLARVAQVTLKELRPLIVVPREMPLNIIHLENMLRLARAGGVIMPAAPGFYHRPAMVSDLIDHVVGKVLDLLGLEHNLYRRWEGMH